MIKVIDETEETTYKDYDELFYTKLVQRKVDFNRKHKNKRLKEQEKYDLGGDRE